MTDLVKMVRDGKFADVHPSEVENYKLGDWRVAEPEPKPKPKTGKQDKKESAE